MSEDGGGAETDALLKALAAKEDGNIAFKDGDLLVALQKWKLGLVELGGLNEENTGDDQVKATIVALQNNISMVHLKVVRATYLKQLRVVFIAAFLEQTE
jgi:hypothetical protein